MQLHTGIHAYQPWLTYIFYHWRFNCHQGLYLYRFRYFYFEHRAPLWFRIRLLADYSKMLRIVMCSFSNTLAMLFHICPFNFQRGRKPFQISCPLSIKEKVHFLAGERSAVEVAAVSYFAVVHFRGIHMITICILFDYCVHTADSVA